MNHDEPKTFPRIAEKKADRCEQCKCVWQAEIDGKKLCGFHADIAITKRGKEQHGKTD